MDGKLGHEITQIYLAEFKAQTLYQQEIFKVVEGSKITYAKWVSLKDVSEGKKVLYPNGLYELLQDLMVKR
jgi:hypothetical protein